MHLASIWASDFTLKIKTVMTNKFLLFIISVIFIVSGCKKDFLDRQPLSQISPDAGFNTETELKLYVRSFYDRMLPNSDNNNKGVESLYNEDYDNIIKNSLSDQLTGNRVVPVSGGGWDWSNLRNINYFLQNYNRGKLDTAITYKYVGVARFFRAYFYYNMVATFGDVPWYSSVIESNDSTLLQKARDPRTLVMDSVLADINFAIAHLGTGKSVSEATKWTALALKSRIALFEGTFRKYHTEFSLPGADHFLQECVNASQQLITTGPYTVYKSTPDNAYRNLFSSPAPISDEVILTRQYNTSLQVFHNLNYYTTTPSYGKPGLEKKLVNSYLMKDGSRFTDIPGYDTIQFFNETQNRDPRLAQTIRTPGYTRLGSTIQLAPDFGATTTGYQLTKYVSVPSEDNYNMSTTPLHIFRFAEVLLNYAEARAELGNITQADLDLSIKQLRTRVAMPNMNLAEANANPDPYLAAQYTHVSGANEGILLEIRRERRIELIMEGFRWNDLMRWKEGHLLALQYKGMYFPGPGQYDLDKNGKIDAQIYTGSKPSGGGVLLKLGSDIDLENGQNGGNIVVNKTISKKFNEDRDYLFPLPLQEMLLNPKLTQNPGWK
jgi:starch-binding outer membrane protein, SusD/RagB family